MFDGQRILLAGLCEMVLPAATIRLCDGGLIDWPARGLFRSADPDFGTLGSVDAVGEAIDDQAPSGRLTLMVPTTEAAVELAQADAQGSPIRFWMAEADVSTGLIVGEPELMFDGMLDTVGLSLARGTAEVSIEYVSAAEALFMVREGNVLSDSFHQRAWPGEKGFEFCTGTAVQVPWGTTGPPRGRIAPNPASALFP